MVLRMLGSLAVWALVLAVGFGYALPTRAADDVALRRDEGEDELVLVSDDDDDDDDTDDGDDSNSAYSSNVNSNDRTGSGHTAVSRDNDRSRDDKTRDWTRDGGSRTRDFSQNRTNDASRNDTR